MRLSIASVAIEAIAVSALMTPSSRYTGFQTVTALIRWVVPQARMNEPKATKIQWKPISRRLLAK